MESLYPTALSEFIQVYEKVSLTESNGCSSPVSWGFSLIQSICFIVIQKWQRVFVGELMQSNCLKETCLGRLEVEMLPYETYIALESAKSSSRKRIFVTKRWFSQGSIHGRINKLGSYSQNLKKVGKRHQQQPLENVKRDKCFPLGTYQSAPL